MKMMGRALNTQAREQPDAKGLKGANTHTANTERGLLMSFINKNHSDFLSTGSTAPQKPHSAQISPNHI